MEIFKLFGSIFINNEEADQSLAKTEEKGQKTGLSLGEAFANIGKAGAVMATAIVGASTAIVGGLMSMANDTAAYADEIDKLSERTGINREELQRWKYAAEQSGVGIDKLNEGMKTMSAAAMTAAAGGEDMTANFAKLGISIDDLKTKSQEDIFEQVVLGLADMEDGAERNALANSVLGGSYADMLPLLNAGADGIEALKDRADELGLVLSEEAIKDGVAFGDTMADVQATLGSLGREIGSAVMPMLTKFLNLILDNMPTIQSYVSQFTEVAKTALGFILDNLLPPITEAVQWFLDNLPTILPILAGIAAGIAALNAVKMIQSLIDGFKAMKAATEGASLAQQALNLVMSANPLGIVIAAVVGLTTVLVTLWNTNENFRIAVTAAWESILAKGQEVWGWISDFFTKEIPAAIDKTLELFSNLPRQIGEFLAETVQKIIGFYAEFYSYLYEKIVEVLGWLVDNFWELPGKIWSALLQVIEDLKSWGLQLVTTGKEEIGKFVQGVIDAVKDLPNTMLNLGRDLVTSVADGVRNGFGGAMQSIQGVFSSIGSGIKQALFGAAGEVNEGTGFLTNAVRNKAKKDLDIHGGGSRAFGEEVGKPIAQGFAAGIEQNASAAADAADKMAKDAFGKAKLWIDDYRNQTEYTVAGEIKMWEALREEYSQHLDMKIEIERNINKLSEESAKAAFEHSKYWIEQQQRLNQLSAEDTIGAWQRVQERYAEGTELRKKADEELYKAEQQLLKEKDEAEKNAYTVSKERIEANKRLGILSASEELAAWQDVQKQYIEGSELRKKADEEVYKAQEQLRKNREDAEKQSYQLSKERIELSKRQGILNAREELDAWKQIQTQYIEGTELRKQADEEAYKAQERLAAEQQSLMQKMTEAENQYQSAVESRSDALSKAYGLFDEIKEKEGVNRVTLLNNLSDQVKAMERWAADIAKLSARGIEEGLLKQLQEMGPQASAEISALSRMTDRELEQYNALWVRKNEIAREQATKELEQLREDANKELEKLSEELATLAGDDISSLGTKMIEGIKENLLAETEGLKDIFNEAIVLSPEEETDELLALTETKLTEYVDLWKLSFDDINKRVASALNELRKLADNEITRMVQSLDSIVRSMAYPIGVMLGQELGQGLISQQAALYEQAQRTAAAIRAAFGGTSGGSAPGTFQYVSNVPMPSHATGLDYVPYDGYTAMLHKGEAVLTADENRAYQEGQQTGVVVNQYFYGVKEERTAFELKRAAEKAAREVLA